jgi:cell division protein FtsB
MAEWIPNQRRIVIGLAILATLALMLFVGLAFVRQIARAQQVRVAEQDLEGQVADAWAQNGALQEQLEYVRSDEYVEHWARRMRMAKPGEVVVIPVADPSGDVPQEPPPPPPEPEADPFWVEWWNGLFGGGESP